MTERVPLLRKVKTRTDRQAELTIEQALRDTNLLGAALGNPNSWSSWLTVLKAAFGQELTAAELKTFHAVAGERPVPRHTGARTLGDRRETWWEIADRSRRCGLHRLLLQGRTASHMVRSGTSSSLQHQEIRHRSCSSIASPSSNKVRSCARRCCRSPQVRSGYAAMSSSVCTPTHSAMSEEER